MRQITVRFTASGANHEALTAAAYEILRNYVPLDIHVDHVDLAFDVSPSVHAGTGVVLGWEAEVTAHWSEAS